MSSDSIVLMVDDKRRDLLVATMIAKTLEKRNIRCQLIPLEAYQGVLAAYRPRMIIFNHLTASHLVRYSKRLAGMGVLTGVLLSEGICYEREERLYNAGQHHKGAHIDIFFSWNHPVKEAMEQTGFGKDTRIAVTGPPRFDMYYQPWSKLFQNDSASKKKRPQILLCTNFVFSKYQDLPQEQVDQFFAPWKDRIALYRDYNELVACNYRAKQRVFDFLTEIARSKKFDLTVRPHPRESLESYQSWMKGLPPEEQEGIRIDRESPITELLFQCDLHISCEDCTTAMEAWMAGKPTIELTFERHPVFFGDFFAKLQPLCDKPQQLIPMIDAFLSKPQQEAYQKDRKEHLKMWCDDPCGKSIEKMADQIAQLLKDRRTPDWSELNAQDFRRAWKLKLWNAIGHAYHFDPFLKLKKLFLPQKYKLKADVYQKSIRPADVQRMRDWVEKKLK